MKIKLVEWQDECGMWHATDTSALGSGSNEWWRIPRALGMPLAAFIELIITKYKPDRIKYFEDNCVLILSWKKQAAMRLYKNNINAMLRKAGAQ